MDSSEKKIEVIYLFVNFLFFLLQKIHSCSSFLNADFETKWYMNFFSVYCGL